MQVEEHTNTYLQEYEAYPNQQYLTIQPLEEYTYGELHYFYLLSQRRLVGKYPCYHKQQTRTTLQLLQAVFVRAWRSACLMG